MYYKRSHNVITLRAYTRIYVHHATETFCKVLNEAQT